MGKIFCLMGKSSSGKDTIFKDIKKQFGATLTPLVSYTTRPKRIGEAEGREYHFITKQQLENYEAMGKVIEQRVYHTVQGPWFYATIDDGNIDLRCKNYIVIVTLEAYTSLVNYFGQNHVVPFYIDLEDGVRLERALKREQQQVTPDYDELCRRFIADNKDFSKENLLAAHIERSYMNNNHEVCSREICQVISEVLDQV